MMCLICGRLVRLGVFVTQGTPADGMVCWPCYLEFESQPGIETLDQWVKAEAVIDE